MFCRVRHTDEPRKNTDDRKKGKDSGRNDSTRSETRKRQESKSKIHRSPTPFSRRF